MKVLSTQRKLIALIPLVAIAIPLDRKQNRSRAGPEPGGARGGK